MRWVAAGKDDKQVIKFTQLVRLSILTRFWSWKTLDVWIAARVGGTETVGKLVIRLAHCCTWTRVVCETGVSTQGQDTGVVVQAVPVQLASSWWSWFGVNC